MLRALIRWVFGIPAPAIERAPVPCPYCPNPDRNSVFNSWAGCQWVEDSRVSSGADPPCVCDDHPTREQLSNLGLR